MSVSGRSTRSSSSTSSGRSISSTTSVESVDLNVPHRKRMSALIYFAGGKPSRHTGLRKSVITTETEYEVDAPARGSNRSDATYKMTDEEIVWSFITSPAADYQAYWGDSKRKHSSSKSSRRSGGQRQQQQRIPVQQPVHKTHGQQQQYRYPQQGAVPQHHQPAGPPPQTFHPMHQQPQFHDSVDDEIFSVASDEDDYEDDDDAAFLNGQSGPSVGYPGQGQGGPPGGGQPEFFKIS